MSERTLVLVKPDGVERGLVGEVISRIERKGLRLVTLELRRVLLEAGAEPGELRVLDRRRAVRRVDHPHGDKLVADADQGRARGDEPRLSRRGRAGDES